jgi:hypothetical protein
MHLRVDPVQLVVCLSIPGLHVLSVVGGPVFGEFTLRISGSGQREALIQRSTVDSEESSGTIIACLRKTVQHVQSTVPMTANLDGITVGGADLDFGAAKTRDSHLGAVGAN